MESGDFAVRVEALQSHLLLRFEVNLAAKSMLSSLIDALTEKRSYLGIYNFSLSWEVGGIEDEKPSVSV